MPKNPPSKPSGQAAPVPKSEEGRSLTLYELTGTYAELAILLDADESPEADANLTALLETFRGEIKERVDFLGRVVAQKKAEIEWVEEQAKKFSDEAQRLQGRAGVRVNNLKKLNDFIADCLAEFGDDTQKIEGATFTTTLAKRGDDIIVVIDEDFIPNKYEIATLKMPHSHVPNELRDAITNVVISKTLINEAFKEDGVIPPGCEVQPKKRTLRQY